jgi:large subunit ribosomal protein L21
MYAVIQDGGRQLRVQEGDRVELDHRALDAGQQIELQDVLMCSGPKGTFVGTPTVEGAAVLAEVTGHPLGPKIKVQKFRRRKGYRRLTGHRQQYTEVQIREIRFPKSVRDDEPDRPAEQTESEAGAAPST